METRPSCRPRLICFHHAGGSAASFGGWKKLLPGVEVHPVQLPGRDPTASPKLHVTLPDLLPDLFETLRSQLATPYALYGHSLGAIVAFEVARAARRASLPLPSALFVAARRAPQLELSHAPLYSLSDEALMATMKEMGGSSQAFDNEKWRRYFMPPLRADLEVSDAYAYRAEVPLEIPLWAFRGEGDPLVTQPEIEAWGLQAGAGFSATTLPGRHFFTADGSKLLAATIQNVLCPTTQEMP